MDFLSHYNEQLDHLKMLNQYRVIPSLAHDHHKVVVANQSLINISSNDYLGLASDPELQHAFIDSLEYRNYRFGASSSRLLTGNTEILDRLENDLLNWLQMGLSALLMSSSLPGVSKQATVPKRSALVFNSGYHANIGLLPALTKLPLKTLILADKQVHASLIDGILLSRCDYQRYRHNDHDQLRQLVATVDERYQRIIIVTESLFSMDGDYADLVDLVRIKQSDPRIELYIDEAHAVGVVGQFGLGLAEQTQTLAHIDYLVGTFGKAFASVGAYVFCHPVVKKWLINTMRPLIFSTALPSVNHAWSRFVLAKMPNLTDNRQRLHDIACQLRAHIANLHGNDLTRLTTTPSPSPIIPYILGSNEAVIDKAKQLQSAGFYALPIRPPTVPKGSARIRLVANAAIHDEEYQALLKVL